jgi:isoaspartyl peptidase/L-asparaginase-like protein (Ntn-hydrolase superfamily)
MLVGEGARKWAHEHNIEEVGDDSLKTESILKSHRHYKQQLNIIEEHNKKRKISITKNDPISSSENENKNYNDLKENHIYNREQIRGKDETRSLDTVGAVVLDQ